MKKLAFILVSIVGLTACQKEETVEPTTTTTNQTTTNSSGGTTTAGTVNTAGLTLVVEGAFESGAHPTSGKVKVYQDKDKKLSLALEGFKTDAGPDLRIYLAEDKAITNFVEITNMVKNGDNIHSMPASVDVKKQKYVLIWCRQFSVLFGSAQLK